MGELGNMAYLESELIKRNREIAKVRDEVHKVERRLEESVMRNDDLLEKVSELDGEVTKKNLAMNDLETKAEELRTQIEAKTAECEKLRDDLTSELESARIELATKEASWKEELVSFEADKARIIELELGQEKLRKEVEDERLRHEDSKVGLDRAENSSREVAGKSIEMRRRVKELEEQLEETQVGLSAAKTKEVEEAKSQADTEIQRVTALLEENIAVRADLEKQVSDLERELADSRAVLEDAQRELGERSAASASVQVARDEALSTLEALKAAHGEVLTTERRRNEEFLDRANSQAASLDGRLTGQRMLFEETSEALSRSEATEQQMSLELAEKVRELASEHELARSALERAQEQAAREVREREERHASTLQSEEVCMQRQMRAEVDAASRETSEAKEEQQRLQARLDRSLESISQAQSQHEQQLEGHRGSTTELRTRLSEAEERTTSEEREVERLGRAAEATKLEAERVTMAHKLEVERLQAMLEADSQSRSSAEQIATSKLEEKDTLLEYRESSLQRAQAELEDARKRISDFEETVSKIKDGVELKASHLSVRNAELEGELRRRNEHIQEVEGRLDAQRQYLEQLNSTLSEAQVDRESLKDAKGTLEAQLHLEQSHKDAVATSLATAQEDSSLRINELEERAARESEAHRAALAEVKVSLSEELRQGSACSASMEEELRSMRERCEILLRQKADLQQQVGEKQELQTSFEAQLQEQRAEQERLKLELEQLGRGRQQLEEERDRTLEERRDRDSQIKLLKDQVVDVEAHRGQQCDGFDSKVKQLDDLLSAERDQREAAERALRETRQDLESSSMRQDKEWKEREQEFRSQVDGLHDKAQTNEEQLSRSQEQAKARQINYEALDADRRKMESQLRAELATSEARLRRLEAEVQRAQGDFTQQQAALAQQKADMTVKITSLERQLDDESVRRRAAEASKQALEFQVSQETAGSSQLRERLAMAAEELFVRQGEFALEKQRLSGALEESRRTLRNCLGVPNPSAAVDSARVSSLEKQISEERSKTIENVVALQRTERRCVQLDDALKRAEEQRNIAVQQARLAEREQLVLNEGLRRASSKVGSTDQRSEEVRESAAMVLAEMSTVRYESKYEAARLRGALDELRYMLKMQDLPGGGSLSRTLPSNGYPRR